MTRVIQVLCVILGLPVLCFFLIMTIPVVLFAVPSIFIGNPLNGFFVLWWGIGGYAIYSTIRAILALGKTPYAINVKYQIGILLGIITFLPLIPLSLSGAMSFGIVSEYITYFAVLSMIPASYLLIYSLIKAKT